MIKGETTLTKMATLSLKISVVGQNVVKTMQFEPNMQVFDACRIIRDKLIETTTEKINRKYFVILRFPLSDHPPFFGGVSLCFCVLRAEKQVVNKWVFFNTARISNTQKSASMAPNLN